MSDEPPTPAEATTRPERLPMIGRGQRRASSRRYGYAANEPIQCICREHADGTSTRRGALHSEVRVFDPATGQWHTKRCRHSTLLDTTRPFVPKRRPVASPKLSRRARELHLLGS